MNGEGIPHKLLKMKKYIVCILWLLLVVGAGQSGAHARSGRVTTIYGKITCNGQPVPFATVTLRGTTVGTATDKEGNFRLSKIAPGEHKLMVSCVGYKDAMQEIAVDDGQNLETNVSLREDLLEMDAVVVTGNKEAIRRSEAPTIVNTISPKLMRAASARTISEGLVYIPGVRMENNCQNCGFNQVRLNGMEGEYTQILVDGYPIFSGLMGVYGMELIPANMISRIEIQRGAGSALYGSNAVAGTVNIILQDPMTNSFEAGGSTAFSGVAIRNGGKVVPDYNLSFNSSNVTDDNRTGLAVYGNYRHREAYDYDNDGYSEFPRLINATLGTRLFQRLGQRGKLSCSYFHISEDRRGGDQFDKPAHEANITEQPKHNINSASVVYNQLMRSNDNLSINAAMQHVKRDSYYGGISSGHPLKDYGLTEDLSYNFGAQYSAHFAQSTLMGGVDFTGENLKDEKPGNTDYSTATPTHNPTLTVADQRTQTVGGFLQYSYQLGMATLTAGARLDRYFLREATKSTTLNGAFVPVPRASLLLKLLPELQLRVNYSMGYRKPQLYNEELHVEVAGARQIVQRVSDDLRRETSHSAMLSLDFNKQWEHIALGVLAEGFFTRLNDAFINIRHDEDPNGVVLLERSNHKSGANIQGVNLEMNVASQKLALKLGTTLQKSYYLGEVPSDLNNGQRDFLRAPNVYGFLMGNWKFYKGFALDATFKLTGPMNVVYEGKNARNPAEQKEIDDNEFSIRRTPWFYDMGLKLSYDFKLASTTLQLYGGVKNLLNSYQNDFDKGAERASSYVYGPMLPRTLYIGFKLGNI